MPVRILAGSLLAIAASFSSAQPLPVFPAKNVPETFHGTVVDDPYRSLEDVKDPQVSGWMKAHAAHARATIEGLPDTAMRGRDRRARRRSRSARRRRAPHARRLDLLTRRGAKDNTYKLYVRSPKAQRLLADPDDCREAGRPAARDQLLLPVARRRAHRVRRLRCGLEDIDP
jgi:prolyl oligopeptidase